MGNEPKRDYVPEDEAYHIYRVIRKLNCLFESINTAEDFWDLLTARRTCELVIADVIKDSNWTLEGMRKRFPEIEINDFKPVKPPHLAIN